MLLRAIAVTLRQVVVSSMRMFRRNNRSISWTLPLAVLLSAVVMLSWDELRTFALGVAANNSPTVIEIPSEKLAAFYGKPRVIRAIVVAPPKSQPTSAQAVMYHFGGFGESLDQMLESARRVQQQMQEHPERALWHLFVDPVFEGRYSYFTDSPNNGPVETAFLTEFVPEFEKRYLSPHQHTLHFLTGHSSGGWVALWLALHNPARFDGVWATAPDPADFTDFFGVNLLPGSAHNMYRSADGSPRAADRTGALGFATLEQYLAADAANGWGDMASYEAAFSKSDPQTGAARLLFDRASGVLNQQTLQHWQQFDLRHLLSTMSPAGLAQLKGKLHIWVGSEDDFFLERPTQAFCEQARALALEPECVVVPGRGHRDLYRPHPDFFPEGLLSTILSQAASKVASRSR